MKKLKLYLNRIYRLTLDSKKQEELFWNDLKRFHSNADWRHGVYEKDKYIETILDISDGNPCAFNYMIYESYFHCLVKILEDFPVELTTDLFILAAHFNNMLNNGVVIVNVNERFVQYHQKRDLLIPLLYKGEIHVQIKRHFNVATIIFSAFQRLVKEQEAPAIIIADLLRKNEMEDKNAE